MKMDYTAMVLRGWPADGAREKAELIKQGSTLINGDVVEMQVDGSVDKVSATANKRVGLVIRGNGDSSSALNANGFVMTPQPSKTVTALTWSGGFYQFVVAAHGYAVGNTITVTSTGSTANAVAIAGAYVIVTVVDTNTFTVAQAATPGVITLGATTSVLTSNSNNSGKAVVLWGNYIVQTSNYNTASSFVPGSPVTGKSGKYDLANGTTDPEAGYVLQVFGVSASQTQSLVIVAY
jgi:hypothetical protein